jgi:tetratricopeptide (TPR) repeat protein
VLKAVLDREPRPPRTLRRDLPKALEAILLKSLEKSPARRYGSAQEMAEDLQRFLGGQKVNARRPSQARRLGRAALKHPALSALVVVVLALLISSGTLLWKQQQAELRDKIAEARLMYSRATQLQAAGSRLPSPEQRQHYLAEASRLATQVILADESLALAWLVRGQVHQQQGDFEPALRDLDHSEQLGGLLNSEHKVLLEHRIHILSRSRPDQYLERLRDDVLELVRLDQGIDTRCLVIDQLILLAAELSGEQRQDVLSEVERMLGEIGKRNATTAMARAQLLEMRGRAKEAEEAVALACQDYPGNAMVRRQAGQVYRRLGMVDEALAEEAIARSMLGFQGVQSEAPELPVRRPNLDTHRLVDFLRQVNRVLDIPKDQKGSRDTDGTRK